MKTAAAKLKYFAFVLPNEISRIRLVRKFDRYKFKVFFFFLVILFFHGLEFLIFIIFSYYFCSYRWFFSLFLCWSHCCGLPVIVPKCYHRALFGKPKPESSFRIRLRVAVIINFYSYIYYYYYCYSDHSVVRIPNFSGSRI